MQPPCLSGHVHHQPKLCSSCHKKPIPPPNALLSRSGCSTYSQWLRLPLLCPMAAALNMSLARFTSSSNAITSTCQWPLRLKYEHALHHTSPFRSGSLFIHPDTTYSDTSPPWLLQFRPPVMCTATPFGKDTTISTSTNAGTTTLPSAHLPVPEPSMPTDTHPLSAFFVFRPYPPFRRTRRLLRTASVMDYQQYPLLRLLLSYSSFSRILTPREQFFFSTFRWPCSYYYTTFLHVAPHVRHPSGLTLSSTASQSRPLAHSFHYQTPH